MTAATDEQGRRGDEYPSIPTCTRCSRQRWSGPALVCGLCRREIEAKPLPTPTDPEP